jgi:Fic family protein
MSMSALDELAPLDPASLETVAVYRKLAEASRLLGEFKGVVAAIPNQRILLSALSLQEAKDSSAIENIVTTHDDLFRSAADEHLTSSPAAKEVLRYRQALDVGWSLVKQHGLLTGNYIQQIQGTLEPTRAGFRKVPGTVLKDQFGRIIYTPPQDARAIVDLMGSLEQELNEPAGTTDPLVRMAILHHRFESIHPFYDGNGRTGRIVNVLYLLKEGLLDLPVLYLSHHIVRTKPDYYRLLQKVRIHGDWESWVLYMLNAVSVSARDGIATVNAIREALLTTKRELRAYPFYSQDLLNNLFTHPYTKVSFIEQDLGVSRITATKYLNVLTERGMLRKIRAGRSNYYINIRLFDILTRES